MEKIRGRKSTSGDVMKRDRDAEQGAEDELQSDE